MTSGPPCASFDDPLQAAKGVALKAGLQASLVTMFDAAMFKAWPLAKSKGISSSSVRKCVDYNHGDFQCNAAMSLFKALKVGELMLTSHCGYAFRRSESNLAVQPLSPPSQVQASPKMCESGVLHSCVSEVGVYLWVDIA